MRKDVLLVCMPWASIEQPSLALGLVKALLEERGLSVDVRYLNLEFAAVVGLENYRSLKDRDVLACDWIFAESMFGPFRDAAEFLGYLRDLGYEPKELERWGRVQKAAGAFVEASALSIDWGAYKVVGFTTTMVQSLAALALARLAKASNPALSIVFGGANCEGEMGAAMIDNFEFIDVVVRRDCDAFVGDLFSRLCRRESLSGLPVCYRESGAVHTSAMPEVFTNLDSNPFPVYDDYFEQLQRMPYCAEVRVNIVFEGSRGCWYGEKVPCTFCAVNGSSMKYRAKSPKRLVDELAHLAGKHDVRWFGAADNILDFRSQKELCHAIEERIPGAKIFFDVKSNLTRAQLIQMKRAGIDEVQPGIESFSTRVLKLMQKGVSGIRNVWVLRMFSEVGIWPMWNYLYGFPGEALADYELLNWVNPALFHLPAPYVGFGLSMMRFSEYFNNPQRWGVRVRAPIRHYNYIFDLPDQEISRLAYYFDYDYESEYDPSATGELVRSVTKAWNHAYYIEQRSLVAVWDGHCVEIRDDRFGAVRLHRLQGLAATAYRLLERPRTEEVLCKLLVNGFPGLYLREGGRAGVQRILRELRDQRLVFTEAGQDLAVAVPADSEAFWLWPAERSVEEKERARLPLAGSGRPKPSLLHWKVDHLYEQS